MDDRPYLTMMLRVAFFYWSAPSGQRELFDILMNKAVLAVRKHMPYAEVWHLRGSTIPKYPGADHDIVLNYFNRPRHHSLMPAGNTLFLDIDCLVQKDVYEVFNHGFDIAPVIRSRFDVKKLPPIERPRYNGGVVFSRCRKFWEQFAEFFEKRGCPWTDPIYSEFIGECVRDGRFTFKEVHGSIYNYTPLTHDEDVSERAIVHYKGEKKKYWMKHLQ